MTLEIKVKIKANAVNGIDVKVKGNASKSFIAIKNTPEGELVIYDVLMKLLSDFVESKGASVTGVKHG
jgi:hypothetical protein